MRWNLALGSAAALLLIAVGVGGHAVEVAPPPDQEPTLGVPALVPVSSDVPAAVRAAVPTLASESAERRARKLTVRVRNISCYRLAVGSGFAVARDILITNRHVLAGAERIDVSTWDGRTLHASSASVGVLGDVGIAIVDGTLPLVGQFGKVPKGSDNITVVGYPLGSKLTLTEGTVVDLVDGERLGIPGRVMRLTARVQPGNSGGPVLDRSGKIVGVVYAIEIRTGFGLAIPVDTLRTLARAGGFEDVPPCGSA
jgi:S1-C subfamily serine protease